MKGGVYRMLTAYFSLFFYRTRYVSHTFILDSSVFPPCVFSLCGET